MREIEWILCVSVRCILNEPQTISIHPKLYNLNDQIDYFGFCFACTVRTVDSTVNYAKNLFLFKLISCTNNKSYKSGAKKVGRTKNRSLFVGYSGAEKLCWAFNQYCNGCIQSTLHQIQFEYHKSWLK